MGGTKEKWGGTSKKFRPRFAPALCPPLANCFRRHCVDKLLQQERWYWVECTGLHRRRHNESAHFSLRQLTESWPWSVRGVGCRWRLGHACSSCADSVDLLSKECCEILGGVAGRCSYVMIATQHRRQRSPERCRGTLGLRQTVQPVFLLHSSIQSKPAAGGFYPATAIISRKWTPVTALQTLQKCQLYSATLLLKSLDSR